MNTVKKAVTELLDEATKAGLNLSQLARKSGVTRVTLSNWRNARSAPTLEKFLTVQQAVRAHQTLVDIDG